MGTYTEVLFRGEVKDLPDEAVHMFTALANGVSGEGYRFGAEIDHEFFQCERWDSVFLCNSAYFETPAPFHFMPADFGPTGYYELFFHSSLKNYGSEIEKFFAWIQPYVVELEGRFIGYSLYEEADTPTLYFKEASE